MSISLKSEGRPLPTREPCHATAPRRKSPVAGGGMKGELEEEQWLICARVAQPHRGPGTAHIVF